MQLELTLRPPHPLTVPAGYHYQVQSAVYALLSDAGYAAALHDAGQPQGFTFGSLHGAHTYREGRLCFSDTIRLEIRGGEAFGDALREGLLRRGAVRLFDTSCPLERLQVTRVVITEPEITVQTDSPVLAVTRQPDGTTVFHAPGEPAFAERIQENYRRKYLLHFGTEPAPLTVLPLGTHRKVVTRVKGMWLTAWSGAFCLRAEPAGLTMLYDAGLGARNAQGFGMLHF